MRAFFVPLLAAALLVPAVAVAQSVDDVTELKVERYFIGFFDTPTLREGDTYQGERVVAVDLDLDFVIVETTNPAVLVARAKLDQEVRYVELDDENYAIPHFVPNDYFWTHSSNWGTRRIGATTAWDLTLGSTAVKVAHTDSGLNKAHEEFAGQARVLQGWDFADGDNTPQDTSGCNFHGTHTTGTAAATINNGKGFAGLSQHTILPVKVLKPMFGGCSGAESWIVNGLKYGADQGAHISQNSWGGAASTPIADAIQYVADKGVLIVASAGNTGPCTNCVEQPWIGKASVVVIVSATTSTDGLASFSSNGPQIDIGAPGDGIGSSTGSKSNSYHIMSGTSMAAPHVSGVAALVKALNPTFTASQIESRLKGTAIDLGAVGFDNQFGNGLLNAAGAVY